MWFVLGQTETWFVSGGGKVLARFVPSSRRGKTKVQESSEVEEVKGHPRKAGGV